MDSSEFLSRFCDHIAPGLDPYEQAIYLHVVRHSHLVGRPDAIISIASASANRAIGTGNNGGVMAPSQIHKKIRSLVAKGFLEIVESTRLGLQLRAHLPEQIPGLIPEPTFQTPLSLDEMDFFNVLENRQLILNRENHQCFYCLRKVSTDTYVIEHVVSRPAGNDSYRNLVAACRRCNNRKGEASAQDFLRLLYREGLLSDTEHAERQESLLRLLSGELLPILPQSGALAAPKLRATYR